MYLKCDPERSEYIEKNRCVIPVVFKIVRNQPTIVRKIYANNDTWTKLDGEPIMNVMDIEFQGLGLVDDISIMYDSDLDAEPNANNQVGLAKILEQVIDEILEKKIEKDGE